MSRPVFFQCTAFPTCLPPTIPAQTHRTQASRNYRQKNFGSRKPIRGSMPSPTSGTKIPSKLSPCGLGLAIRLFLLAPQNQCFCRKRTVKSASEDRAACSHAILYGAADIVELLPAHETVIFDVRPSSLLLPLLLYATAYRSRPRSPATSTAPGKTDDHRFRTVAELP